MSIPLRWLVLLLVLASGPGTSRAATIRVEPEGDLSIQEAVNRSAAGDTVLLAAGTYQELLTITGKSLVLRGESGAESTVLDGAYAGRILAVTGVAGPVVVEGITFMRGISNFLADPGGAAILALASPVEIRDCIFRDNHVLVPGNGGAILSTFFAAAGGPPVGAPDQSVLQLRVSSTLFEDNTASGDGGAVDLCEVPGIFTECTFQRNQGTVGGAVNLLNEEHVFVDCRFANNTARFSAGALAYTGDGRLDLTRVEFRSNLADDYGGAVRVLNAFEVRLLTCWFIGNQALRGGGADFTHCGVQAEGVLWWKNNAGDRAAGVFLDATTGSFLRNTWIGNTGADRGASFTARDCPLQVNRCILADDNLKATECVGSTSITGGCNVGSPLAGSCVPFVQRATVSTCSEDPAGLCVLLSPAGCGLVGHAEIECTSEDCGTPAVPVTWGHLKTMYGRP